MVIRGVLSAVRASRWRSVWSPTGFAAGCAVLVLGAIMHAGWLCEDAFITLRTVDNWVNGHGLRWNVGERVQSFTHPLWMFLVAAVYWPTRDAALGLLVPSIAASLAFLALFVRGAADKRVAGALILLLGASKAFVEFSSPGLENPLVHALLVAYLFACLHTLRVRTTLWRLTALVALLLITRADLLWLIAPSFVAAAWCARAELLRLHTWLGFLPLVAWELFSLLYYGFPVPNTAYAKLSTGVPFHEAITQGLRYLKSCWLYDPVTALTLVLTVALGLASRRRGPLLLAIGMLSWAAYLVRVGGDFMLGRLLTPALIVAVVTLAEVLPLRGRKAAPWAAALIMVGSAALPRSPLWGAPQHTDAGWLPEGVTDERSLAYPTNGLLQTSHPEGPRSHPWVQEALEAVARGDRVVPYRSVGIVGYYAGPTLHIVDEYGLADPLLARLPADPAWGPGHFLRHLPSGYLETLRSGQNRIQEPLLARRYSELASIVRGPVFDVSRLWTIIEWNVLRPPVYPFDYQVRPVPAGKLSEAPGDGARTNSTGVLATEAQGLAVMLDEPASVRGATVTVGSDDRYLVAFRRGPKVLWQGWLSPSEPHRGRLKTYEVSVSEPLTIDSLLLRGRKGDYKYHVGQVTLEAHPRALVTRGVR